MSKQYDAYIQEHKENLTKGFHWIRENLPELLKEDTDDIEHVVCFQHDQSKYDQDEYDAYDAYFYGGNRSYAVVQNFRRAWLSHIHKNPHHWQHWILHRDEPNEGMVVLEMPYKYVIEMICDWWSFSWKTGKLTEIFDWYNQHKDYMKLHDRTRSLVESILDTIKNKLEEK